MKYTIILVLAFASICFATQPSTHIESTEYKKLYSLAAPVQHLHDFHSAFNASKVGASSYLTALGSYNSSLAVASLYASRGQSLICTTIPSAPIYHIELEPEVAPYPIQSKLSNEQPAHEFGYQLDGTLRF